MDCGTNIKFLLWFKKNILIIFPKKNKKWTPNFVVPSSSPLTPCLRAGAACNKRQIDLVVKPFGY